MSPSLWFCVGVALHGILISIHIVPKSDCAAIAHLVVATVWEHICSSSNIHPGMYRMKRFVF